MVSGPSLRPPLPFPVPVGEPGRNGRRPPSRVFPLTNGTPHPLSSYPQPPPPYPQPPAVLPSTPTALPLPPRRPTLTPHHPTPTPLRPTGEMDNRERTTSDTLRRPGEMDRVRPSSFCRTYTTGDTGWYGPGEAPHRRREVSDYRRRGLGPRRRGREGGTGTKTDWNRDHRDTGADPFRQRPETEEEG